MTRTPSNPFVSPSLSPAPKTRPFTVSQYDPGTNSIPNPCKRDHRLNKKDTRI